MNPAVRNVSIACSVLGLLALSAWTLLVGPTAGRAPHASWPASDSPATAGAALEATASESIRRTGSALATRHEVEIVSELRSEFSNLGPELLEGEREYSLRVAGRFVLLVQPQADGTSWVRFVAQDVHRTGRTAAADLPVPDSRVRGEVLFRLARDWRPLDASDLPGTSPEASRLLRSLFADCHTFPLGPGSEPVTLGDLQDDTGRFEATVWASPTEEPGCLRVRHREKRRYQTSATDAAVVHVEHGRAEALEGRDWLERVTLDETLRVDAGGPQLVLVRTLRAHRVSSRTGIEAAFVEPTTWGPIHVPYRAPGAAVNHPPVSTLLENLRRLARQGRLDTRDAWEAREGLIARMLAADADVRSLLQALALERDPAVRAWILSALGAAGGRGSLTAAEALAEVARTSDDVETLIAVLESGHQLGEHGSVLLPLIERLLRSEDIDLSASAAVLAGTLVAGATESSRPGFENLLARARDWAIRNGREDVLMYALANSGQSERTAAAGEFLAHRSATVRRAAAEALAGNPERIDDLAHLARTDEDWSVRAAAASSLGLLSRSAPHALDVLQGVLQAESDPRTRLACANALAAHLPHAGVRSALHAALEREADPQVRESLRKLIAGH